MFRCAVRPTESAYEQAVLAVDRQDADARSRSARNDGKLTIPIVI
jgi:hypothetical protein